MKSVYAGALLLATVLGAPAAALAQEIVKVDAGPVRGVAGDAVDRFLGIPYAQAPVGDLRWRDPLPARTWDAVRDARHASAACYQAAPAAFGPYTGEFLSGADVSEDCQYLNVWRPHGAHGKLPVHVFIHDGAFNSGAGTVPVYDGAALRWVRANIAAFGGDRADRRRCKRTDWPSSRPATRACRAGPGPRSAPHPSSWGWATRPVHARRCRHRNAWQPSALSRRRAASCPCFEWMAARPGRHPVNAA